MGSITRFTNCRVLRNGKLELEDLWVRNGKVIDPQPLFFGEKLRETERVDCKGGIISPGFIDVQINGAYGYDFSSDTGNIEQSLQRVAKHLLAHGVTAFCPTVVTSSRETYHDLVPRMKPAAGGVHGAAIVGIHLEGPFISRKKKGAHCEGYIWDKEVATAQDMESMYGSDLGNVSIVTLAPELHAAGDCSAVRWLTERQRVCVSLGHSTADLARATVAVDCGARFITHLFNAMLPFHHRDPGLVGLLSTRRHVFYGIIADGVHTDMAAIHLAYHSNKKGIVLVSDAMAAAGLGVGSHQLGDHRVTVTESDGLLHARLADQQETLAGSVAMLDSCVRWFCKASQCGPAEALETASEHPARLLGLAGKGSLDFGKDADLVVLDGDLCVQRTFIAGEQVWP